MSSIGSASALRSKHHRLGILHSNLVVKNVGSRKLGICENWNHPDGQWTWGSCSGSPTGTLSKNQNSKTKYGWKDMDGVQVDKGYRLKERVKHTAKGDTYYEYDNVTTCAPSTYWLKVQAKVTRTSRSFYLKKR